MLTVFANKNSSCLVKSRAFMRNFYQLGRTHVNSCAVKCPCIPLISWRTILGFLQKDIVMSHNKKEA
jgi:hypothetical protein